GAGAVAEPQVVGLLLQHPQARMLQKRQAVREGNEPALVIEPDTYALAAVPGQPVGMEAVGPLALQRLEGRQVAHRIFGAEALAVAGGESLAIDRPKPPAL